MAMTDVEKNIAIASLVGWEDVSVHPALYNGRAFGKRGNQMGPIPDYANSLDAMHEAEMCIPMSLSQKYYLCLGTISSNTISATAKERSEAFLKAFYGSTRLFNQRGA